MGLVFDQVSFDRRAPDLAVTAGKITDLCGLRVIVEHSTPEEKGNLYDQHGHVAFECLPEERLELYSYRSGAVRQFYDECFDGVELPIEKHVTGLNEPPGTQAIHLRSFVGLETLTAVALLALEALGGRPRHPFDDDIRREFSRPISESELLERRRQFRKQMRRVAVLQSLLLPVTLPLLGIQIASQLTTLPSRLRKAQQIAKDAIGKRDHAKLMARVPDHLEHTITSPDNHAGLDRDGLAFCSEALTSLGFTHTVDYSVRFQGHAQLTDRPPGFARVWFHPRHRCVAEVNQVFTIKNTYIPIRCTLGSWLDGDWSLSTTNRELASIYYAWRRPRSLWSWHPGMPTESLLDEHLRRRQLMIDALGIGVATESTAEAYFAKSLQGNSERKAVLRSKSISTIREEKAYYKRSGIHEWWGDLAQAVPAG